MVLVPALACVLLAGCGEEGGPPRRMGTGPSTQGNEAGKGSSGPAKEAASTGWAKIRGHVVYQGTAPVMAFIDAIRKHEDRSVCEAGTDREKSEQTWIVGPDGSVANAVLWLQPPENTFFKIKDDMKKPADVKLHQPHCAYMPHAVALFPKYIDKDTGTMKLTGQVLEILNDSPINHNAKMKVGGRDLNQNIEHGKSITLSKLDPTDEPIKVECSIHNWMNAYIWAFDHPYFAVTRDDGNFEIVVPAGIPVTLMGWHEQRKDWGPIATLTLKDGEERDLNNIEISAR